jgi:hypothetical protein
LARPVEAFPSHPSGAELARTWVLVVSGAAWLALLCSGLVWACLRLFRAGRDGLGSLLVMVSSVTMLLPLLSGMSDYLQKWRWWWIAAVLVFGGLLPWVAHRAWLAMSSAPRGRASVVAAFGGTLAIGGWLWLFAKAPAMYGYPEVLVFAFVMVTTGLAAIARVGPLSRLGDVATLRLGFAACAVLLLAVADPLYVSRADAFAHTRAQHGKRYAGVHGLLALSRTVEFSWGKVERAMSPKRPPERIIRPEDTPDVPKPSRTPNVILFVIDALRADHVGAYAPSAERLTPNITQLSRRSTTYARAYSPSSGTGQSMASILTGLSPAVLAQTPVRPLYLPALLRHFGYGTGSGLSGNMLRINVTYAHVWHAPLTDVGFDVVTKPSGATKAEKDAAQVTALLHRIDSSDKPRFEYVHLGATHGPFSGRGGWPAYDSAIKGADEQLGRVVEFLDRHALGDHTILIVASDHGEAHYEHGLEGHNQTVYAEEVTVPLIVSIPGQAPRTVERPTSLTELPSLLMNALGSRWPWGQSGGRGGPLGRADVTIQEYVGLDRLMWRSIRGRDFSYHHRLIDGRSELYDLQSDPTEQRDLSSVDSSRMQYFGRLDREIDAWQETVLESLRKD